MKYVLSLFAVFLFCASVPAQDMGKIQGVIVDAETGEPLIGANVVIKDEAGVPIYGTATNLDGQFTLAAPIGTHNIEVSYITYATKIITDVIIGAKQPTTINISLPPEGLQADEIIVTAKAEQNSEVSMLAMQQKSAIVTDGISAELMSRSSSSDAGDALKRVTGITVVGGKYVYVRGLGERYSNTQVNGADMPSPEPNRRVVPMDIFPAGLLENIQVSKTFSPDQPGDFSGGSVQVKTRDFPDKFTLSFSASGGYHSQTTFKDAQTYAGGSWDFMGIDDGARSLPDIVKTQATDQPIRQRGRFSTTGFTAEEVQAFGQSFSNIWQPRTTSAPVNQSYSVSMGNAIGDGNRELGYVASFTYDNSLKNADENWNTYRITADPSGNQILTPFTTYSVKSTTNSILWGSLFNVSLRLSPLHKISVKTLYNRNTDDEARTYTGFNSDRGTDLLDYRLQFVERGIFTSQLSGDHHFGPLLNSNVEWMVSTSKATRDEPDNREVLYEQRNGEWTFFDITQSGSRFFFDLVDDAQSAKIDWTVPFSGFGSLASKLKFGAKWSTKDRSFDARRFRFEQSSGIQRSVDLSLDPEEIFVPENIAPGLFQLRETTRATDNYSASQDLWATYLLTDFQLSTKWRFVGGFRIENSKQSLISFDPFSTTTLPIEVALDDTDVLPGLNLVYKLTDRTNLRTAYSRTVARPDFRELAPFEFTDFIGGRAVSGNPNLKRSNIDNFDLRYETFPRLGELMAVSAFYKKFHDPIEQIIRPTAQLSVTYQNAKAATNYGLELEFRRRLDAIAPSFEPLSVNVNVTLVKSEIDIEPGLGVQTSDSRALQGQSPYVVNVTLGYDNEDKGLQGNLLYNVFGRRISEVGAQGLPDVYEQPRHQVDLNLKKKHGKFTYKLSAKNLLDSKVLYKQAEGVYREHHAGRSFSLGMSYDR
jgi:outer membrane receptor protein involved in Fe transport